MDGLIVVDKPENITSHDVVASVRRILGIKRVGHTGTLDPFATGVMVIMIGQATRIAQFLDRDEKEYEATVRFGFETDTGDKTGRPTEQCGLQPAELAERVKQIDWEWLLSAFRGDLLQVPPMYSAKKIDGKKLYELARKGKEVERHAVPVFIRRLELKDRSPFEDSGNSVRLKVACSAGTYVRTLAEDIGREVGLRAHLTELRRTRAGRLGLADAITLDDLRSGSSLPIITMSEALSQLPTFSLTDERAEKAKHGLSTRTNEAFTDGACIRMLDARSNLIAIGYYDAAEKIVQPKIVFG